MSSNPPVLVLDTSAIMSILRQEDDAAKMAACIAAASSVCISAVTRLEAFTVALARGEIGSQKMAEFLDQLSPQVIAFDEVQSSLAVNAVKTFGKGHHPARLNFGDCCAYALAKSMNLPLLYKGNDFAQTDIASALA
jgi:ribonuclease VapC